MSFGEQGLSQTGCDFVLFTLVTNHAPNQENEDGEESHL